MSREFYLNDNEPKNHGQYPTEFIQLMSSFKSKTAKEMKDEIAAYYVNTFKSILDDPTIDNKLDEYQKIEWKINLELYKSIPDPMSPLHSVGEKFNKKDFVLCTTNDNGEFEICKNFKKTLASLNSAQYEKIQNNLSDVIKEDKLNSPKKIEQAINYLKAFDNVRKERGIFRKIYDFFTGKSKAEDTRMSLMRDEIRTAAAVQGLNMDNVEGVLASKLTNDAHIIHEPMNQYHPVKEEVVKDTNPSIFTNTEGFVFKFELTPEEFQQNLESLTNAIDTYHDYVKMGSRVPSDILKTYKNEIREACSSMHIGGNDIDYLLKGTSMGEEDIRGYLKSRVEQPEQIEVSELDDSFESADLDVDVNESFEMEKAQEINN